MSTECDIEESFLRFVTKFLVSDGCWEWQTPGDPKHYPKFKLRGEGTLDAHRFSYLLFIGSIEPGLFILHKCDNRRCVRPDHLVAGSAKDNAKDAFAKGRMAPPVQAKLTEFQVAQIKQALRQGENRASIASRFGVHRATIGKIERGTRWPHVA